MHRNTDTSDVGREIASHVLLLKTQSTPSDAYEDYFGNSTVASYTPKFIPVLEHQFFDNVLEWLKSAIIEQRFCLEYENRKSDKSLFGGVIFTSQRAVEAFSRTVATIDRSRLDHLLPERIPFYVVGQATANAVRAIGLKNPVLGEHTGNGDVLADFILDDYAQRRETAPRLALLFLVGEQRRDIIPRKLQSEELPSEQRITVVEKTVYGTTERKQFAVHFAESLPHCSQGAVVTWVVVFSPTGCGAMLRTLGWLNEEGKYDEALKTSRGQQIYIATIGPTTRDFLVRQFGFAPHVCADKPSPEGVGQAILYYKSI